MKTAHFFAGAGGGLYADLILGHTPILAVEWDKYAAGALQQRANDGWFPGLHVHHGDIELFDPSPWKNLVDSLHAGFPCQDISIAGDGEGITGERSGLWSEVVRGARLLGINELFLENSPEIVSRGLDVVLGDIAKLGLDARWCVIPASGVGAPHLRARWWCLARRSNSDSARKLQQERSDKIEWGRPCDICQQVSHSDCELLWNKQECECRFEGKAKLGNDGPKKSLADSNSIGLQGLKCRDSNSKMWKKQSQRSIRSQGNAHGWWSVEPSLGRVANGVANRGNRIKCLGNGQVPLQAAAAYKLLSAQF